MERGKYVVGIGSERGTPLEVVGQGVMQCLDKNNIVMDEVVCITSVHMKAHDPAYTAFAAIHDVQLITCDTLALKAVTSGSLESGDFLPEDISRLSALFLSGARQLMVPPFRFCLSHDGLSVIVSVCRVTGRLGINACA